MSYAVSAALQEAVFQRLSTDAALIALVGSAVFDTAPAGPLPPFYVSLGPEKVRDASDKTGAGALHDFVITVVTTESGFAQAKLAAAAVSDALGDAALTLNRGTLDALWFLRATASRERSGGARRINLTFRARVSDDPAPTP